jgi:hypothetical protein
MSWEDREARNQFDFLIANAYRTNYKPSILELEIIMRGWYSHGLLDRDGWPSASARDPQATLRAHAAAELEARASLERTLLELREGVAGRYASTYDADNPPDLFDSEVADYAPQPPDETPEEHDERMRAFSHRKYYSGVYDHLRAFAQRKMEASEDRYVMDFEADQVLQSDDVVFSKRAFEYADAQLQRYDATSRPSYQAAIDFYVELRDFVRSDIVRRYEATDAEIDELITHRDSFWMYAQIFNEDRNAKLSARFEENLDADAEDATAEQYDPDYDLRNFVRRTLEEEGHEYSEINDRVERAVTDPDERARWTALLEGPDETPSAAPDVDGKFYAELREFVKQEFQGDVADSHIVTDEEVDAILATQRGAYEHYVDKYQQHVADLRAAETAELRDYVSRKLAEEEHDDVPDSVDVVERIMLSPDAKQYFMDLLAQEKNGGGEVHARVYDVTGDAIAIEEKRLVEDAVVLDDDDFAKLRTFVQKKIQAENPDHIVTEIEAEVLLSHPGELRHYKHIYDYETAQAELTPNAVVA